MSLEYNRVKNIGINNLLFNKVMPVRECKKIFYEDIKNFFYIDNNSPSGLRWAIDKGRGRDKRYKGDIAGTLKSNNYWYVKLNQIEYFVHRIIYCLYNKIDLIENTLVIDHIDGTVSENGKNNNPLNLRLVTKQQNQLNR